MAHDPSDSSEFQNPSNCKLIDSFTVLDQSSLPRQLNSHLISVVIISVIENV